MSSDIRNIGVLAHIDAGKTSVTERILHVAGVRSVPGSVDDGTTLTDYLGVERRHGITIKTAAVRFSYRNCRFHLLDTPGHVDFTAEVERVLQVLDGAVIVLCAVSGVQVRTGVIAKACRDHSLPRIYFVNKMDRRGADFHRALQQIKEELQEPAVALQIPIYTGQTWHGIADIVRGVWIPNGLESESSHVLPLDGVPLEAHDRAAIAQATEILLDALSMHDDEILTDLIQGRPPDPLAITHALRRVVLSGNLVPVFCGSSFSDPSIAALMDGIIDY
ncbi:MAG: GTP-binding protein, partial [Spirochaetales bacterium]|nr:GTP-binding protein [Spirochaetales bacterium]